MNLPGPNSGVTWGDYKIKTPTFKLTSIEKPDLSPFLIHLTGRNQLLSILKGENAPEGIEIPQNFGYLKSSIPDYGSKSHYNSEVVCFTESPLFALDFFRFRSFSRWNTDQQFGIGFSKDKLITDSNVRPVIYLDSETNSQVLSVCNRILKGELCVINSDGNKEDLKPLMEKIKPLLFPLLENLDSQGFIWEREWRYPNSNGFKFPLSIIKVICCPANEKSEIEELLSDYLENIQIVENWKEYDEITSFLKSRETTSKFNTADKIGAIKDVKDLRELKQQNDQTLHTLTAYYEVFKDTVNQLEGKNISATLDDLRRNSSLIIKQIENVESTRRIKEEQPEKER